MKKPPSYLHYESGNHPGGEGLPTVAAFHIIPGYINYTRQLLKNQSQYFPVEYPDKLKGERKK